MKFTNRLLLWCLIVSSVISFLSYCSVLISPTFFWPAALVSYSIPFVLIFNILLTIILIIYHWRYAVFPFVVLIFGYPFFKITYQLNSSSPDTTEVIQVLSFNSKFFRKKNVYHEFSTELIKWAADDQSDIKCFQEYSSSNRWEPLNVTKKIKDRGYEGFIFKADVKDTDHSPGMSIFSKHPILDSGYVWNKKSFIHTGMFIDVLYKKDTVRIYNVHLTSMQLLNPAPEHSFLFNPKEVISKFKYATQSRTKQIEKLIDHINESPYPFILCGDFNDVPYTYNYFMLRRHLFNSFEETGNGFGLTYIGKVFFLRIDHQFHGDKIESINFSVDSSIDTSDHFPTRGSYRILE